MTDAIAARLDRARERLDRMTQRPGEVAGLWIRLVTPVLRLVGWQAKFETEELFLLLDRTVDPARDDHLARAIDELEHNIALAERATSVDRYVPTAHASWLYRVERLLRRVADLGNKPGDGAERVLRGLDRAHVLPPLRIVEPKAKAQPKASAPAPVAAPSQPKSEATGSAPTAEGSGEPTAQMANAREARIAETRTLKEGQAGAPPRGKKKPCEKIEEVTALGDKRWRVERSLLDWYATHLRELERQVGVSSYRDEDGKRGGAKLYLPRCSVLRQGGMQNGDVVRTINGRKVNTIAQGVATWLAVRGQKTITVELTRRNGEELVHTYLMK